MRKIYRHHRRAGHRDRADRPAGAWPRAGFRRRSISNSRCRHARDLCRPHADRRPIARRRRVVRRRVGRRVRRAADCRNGGPPGWIVGVLIVALGLWNLTQLAQPLWMQAMSVVAPLARLLAGRTAFPPGAARRSVNQLGRFFRLRHRQRPADLVAQHRLELVGADIVRGGALAQQRDQQRRAVRGRRRLGPTPGDAHATISGKAWSCSA